MTKLEVIDERLFLYPVYLCYRVRNWQLLPFGMLYTLRTEGYIWASHLMSFNEWLDASGRNDLIL